MIQNFVIMFEMAPVVSALADEDTTFAEIHDCMQQSASCGLDWGWPSSLPATDNVLECGLSPVMGPVIDWEEVGLGG